MLIRNEEKRDIRIVEELLRDAFWNTHVPGATEHFRAHQMRKHKDFVNELNMVAEIDGEIVGSIMYTVGRLVCEDGTIKTLSDDAFDGRRWTFIESDACELNAKNAEETNLMKRYKIAEVKQAEYEMFRWSIC